MQRKLGVTVFVSEIKRVVNYTDFEKLSHTIEHGLLGFIVMNSHWEPSLPNAPGKDKLWEEASPEAKRSGS